MGCYVSNDQRLMRGVPWNETGGSACMTYDRFSTYSVHIWRRGQVTIRSRRARTREEEAGL